MAPCDYYIAKTMAHALGGAAIVSAMASFAPQPGLWLGLAEVVAMFVVIFAIQRVNNHSLSLFLFVLIAILFGHLLSYLFDKLKKDNLLTIVSLYSIGIFAGMTVLGIYDKGNFLGIRSYLFAALFGLLFANVISLFIPDVEAFNVDKWLGLAGVTLFALYTASDIQVLKTHAKSCSSAPNYPKEAMELFMDLINIFTHMAEYMNSD